ncbi:lamin tail domain-containing protein [Belliella sp. DSM 107340]|uniref:Lamin tail domain-containing protein n=1 Tax=Belliella calami TaxID=2923436 RepID=A0ABS9UMU9_9BACT|nr:lamin tail domain-containing protein [Belliella calami]MCH7397923.1 lamin tail domain-containing protein [Belliella calami]
MKILLFVWGFIAFSILGCSFFKQAETFAQNQDFESSFNIVNHPDEFLPLWSANEIRSTSSRVFQANGQGRNNSRALAVQPIASFDGVIYSQINLMDLVEPKIAFFAKTNQNGSGNRPVEVFVSFSHDQIQFTEAIQVGNDDTFSNQQTEYNLYEMFIPDLFWNEENVYLKFEVKFGQGSGSAARFFMDDFGVFSGDEQVDPIRVVETLVLDPFRVKINFDREIQVFDKAKASLQGLEILSIDFPDDSSAIIHTASEVPIQVLQLSLENIFEKNGVLTEEVNVSVDNTKIQIGEILVENPNSLVIRFSQNYLSSDVSQTSKFLVNGANPSDISLNEDGFSIKLSLSNGLLLSQMVKIETQAFLNTNQELGLPQTREFVYIDEIETIFAKNQNRISIVSFLELDFESFDFNDFSIIDGEFIFSEWEISDGRKVFDLLSDSPFEEGITYTLRIPSRKTLRGKQLNGSYRDFVWDATPPEVVRVDGISSREIVLVFSEPLDPIFAMILSFYKINGREPMEAQIQGNGNSMILKWDFDFEENRIYVLGIEGVADFAGNVISKTDFAFTFESPKKLAFKNLIINEIMPAPRAGNSLPNVEYIEIYNPSSDPIALGGFQLANSRRTTTIPSEVILPDQYIILCPRTQVNQFSRFGRVIGLTNWPTLLNSADQVKLYDNEGIIIDSLNYTTANFGGSSFASGGYSLEIVNPFIKCNLIGNLKTSIATERGTPGKINSLFDETPDRSTPVLLNASVLSTNQVLLFFSKSLSPDLSNLDFIINPPLSTINIELDPEQNSLLLTFDQIIQEGTQYLIVVNGLRDCIGNLIKEGENAAFFTIPSLAASGDVIINEVLFNANTGGPKFVEIYNQSEKFINLKDWKLANLNTSNEIDNRRIVSSEDLIIEPGGFLVFTTDVDRLSSDYPKGVRENFELVSTLPSYPQSSGNVVWLDPIEEIVEIFSYSERMHHRLLKEVRGVSLERLSALELVENPNNWKSASASVGFATPGYKNSNVFEEIDSFGIEIQPKVFVPDAAGEQNFTQISYKVDQAGDLATMRIYSINGQLIREICQNEIWGSSGFYTWDGTDSNSRKVRPGYYILVVDLFDLEGNVTQIKKTIVVGAKIQ